MCILCNDIILMNFISYKSLNAGVFGPNKPHTAAALNRQASSLILLPHDVPMTIKHAYNCAFTKDNIIATFRRAELSPLQGVSALPDNTVGPHVANKVASGRVRNNTLRQSNHSKFIANGVAFEVIK